MDIVLLDAVRSYAELYNPYHKHYTDYIHRKKVWNDISRRVGRSVDWCRKRWESLRAQHRKVIRARITATDDQDIIQRKWKYEDEMAFLITHMARRAKTRLPEASGREFESGDDRSSCEDFEVKRPVSTLVKTEPNTEDPLGGDAATSAFGRITPDEQEQNDIDLPSPTDALDYFFAWVKGTMRKFTPQDVVEVRTKIFNIVSEAETKYL